MKKLLLIINGVAGKTRLTQQTYNISELLTLNGYEVTVYPVNPSKGMVVENVADRLSEYDLVVCGGGDGTLNHLINSLMPLDKKPLLGFLPAGSTNDFAKTVGIPSDALKACNIIIGGEPFSYDIGKFNDKYFNYVSSFGAFSSISYSTNQDFKNAIGHAAYILNGISKLQENVNYKCHMRITADGIEEEGDYIFGAIYSSTSIGGFGMPDAKEVSLNDGLFELLLIRAPENVLHLGRILNALIYNLEDPNILRAKISSAAITSDDDTAWTLDGEYGGTTNRVDFAVMHRAMTIMAPKKTD